MKTNKLLYGILGLALFGGALSSCSKDEDNIGGLTLLAEGYTKNEKMAVDGVNNYWTDGDQIRVNDKLLTVSIEDGYARVDRADLSYPYCALSPASIYGGTVAGGSLTVSIPSFYTYSENAEGKQVLQVPMTAYAATGENQLLFQHITAALVIHVENQFGFPIQISNITVTSTTHQLWGDVTFTMRDNGCYISATAAADDAHKTVTMNCNGFELACGASKDIQIPVLPVSNNQFTITVTASSPWTGKTYNFSQQQKNGANMSRGQIGYAPVRFGGEISISSTEKVRFSPGNLQYQASTGTWRFASDQYSVVWSDNANIASDYSGWIDLFGWGASGLITQPYETSTDYGYYKLHYVSDDMYGAYSNGDWGYNRISNGGNANGLWRTLRATEWDYIFNTRPGVSYTSSNISISNARYSYVTVNGRNGIMIFPDDISGIRFSYNELPTAVNVQLPWGTGKSYNIDEWKKLEIAGFVFIPVTAWRNGPTFNDNQWGMYWTGNLNRSNAYSMTFKSNVAIATAADNRYHGYAVRLVRNN